MNKFCWFLQYENDTKCERRVYEAPVEKLYSKQTTAASGSEGQQTNDLNFTDEQGSSAPTSSSGSTGLPDPGDLHKVYERLSNTLPQLFIKPMDYSIYNPNLIFEDNIRGRRTM